LFMDKMVGMDGMVVGGGGSSSSGDPVEHVPGSLGGGAYDLHVHLTLGAGEGGRGKGQKGAGLGMSSLSQQAALLGQACPMLSSGLIQKKIWPGSS
jgi:hypothetical protein